jgi:S1-C subfamily serine protease
MPPKNVNWHKARARGVSSFANHEPRIGDWVIAVGNPYGLGGHCLGGSRSLSRFVSREEAKSLIERAIEAAPRDPRCLLARAQIHEGNVDGQIDDVPLTR